MTFMHFDAHTAAAGVAAPKLSGTLASPNSAFGIDNTDGVIPGDAEAGWIFATTNYSQTLPTYETEPGSITKLEWDFGLPSYTFFKRDEEWFADKTYTSSYWIRATSVSGDAPNYGFTVGDWHELPPADTGTPGVDDPFWYWSIGGKFASILDGILKVEIARDGAGSVIIATGYYRGKAEIRANIGSGGGGCFTGDMRILMADGTQKPIRDVREGDMVVSMTSNEVLLPATVNLVMAPRIDNVFEVKLSNGKTIETTREHPFRTASGKWAAIDPEATYQGTLGGPSVKSDADTKLEYGMMLYGFETNATVVGIKDTGRRETVYHLANVGDSYTYFVEGMCVHNITEKKK